ncbi:MAG: aldehyde dehydrogenase family protein [Paracoccaceae bacterium]
MFEAKLHISGIAVDARDGAVFQRTSPVDGKLVTRAAAAGPKDVQDAANAAAAAFPVWRNIPSSEKKAILLGARDLLVAHTHQLVEIGQRELGSTSDWVRFNIDIAAKVFDHAAEIPERMEAMTSESEKDGITSILIRQPAGVVLAIAPWNAAVTLAIRAIIWPLACGNTVVFKASELCPKLHSLIVEILCEAGLPSGAVCSVLHTPESAESVVEALAAHPTIRRINFTGSTRIGRRIAEISAVHLKPCLLELSGKAPLVILRDANIEAAAKAAVFGAYFNQGQICMATERVIVVEEIAEQFVVCMQKHCVTLINGSDHRRVGDLISADSARRVGNLIDEALAKGATLLAGGEVAGAYVQPTLLDHVTPEMQIYGEESFGPVASIIRVHDEAEAITVANDTEYGLVASVYTSDISRARFLASQFETGACHINGPTVYDDPAMPFGGVKASGYGRFGGDAVIEEFTELRWVTVQEPKTEFPYWE